MINLDYWDKINKTISGIRNNSLGILHDKGGILVISNYIENIN